ncbi:hypothetical protein, partial [Escherichia coli]|uniref:hypothetical protein n=1 Tax=Escherichia coli TaxID=562 RepID=UPI00254E7FEA
MSTDWQKILLAAVFADHLLYDQLSPYYQNCFYAKYRIGTGLRAKPVRGGQKVENSKLLIFPTQGIWGNSTSVPLPEWATP